MNKILCPVDFSEASLNAIEYAVKIGGLLSSKVLLLHVFTNRDLETVIGNENVDEEYRQEINLLKEKFEEIIRISEKDQTEKTLTVSYTIQAGNLMDIIQETISENDIDYIFMGSNGVGSLDEAYFGSNTLKVIRHTSCPVICIPRDKPYTPIRKIVYATDFEPEDKRALSDLILWSEALKSEVEVFHVKHSKKEKSAVKIQELVEYFSRTKSNVNFHFSMEISNDSVHETIRNFVDSTGSDMLAVLMKKRNFIDDLFHKSITAYFACYADFPVMVYKC